MTPNQLTVRDYMEGFRVTDRARILACLTDDVEWVIPGAFRIQGKAAFNEHIQDEGFVGSPEITVTRWLEADEIVVAEGLVRTQRADGRFLDLAFCDLFEMTEAKIRRLTSYLTEIR